jgi:ATP-dependent DNA helicase RecG
MEGHDAPLTLHERVRAAIELGESHFREFKSALQGSPHAKADRDPKAIRRDIGEALVAFANADGGELLLGVEDDGRITGVGHGDDVVDTFVAAWKTHVHGKTPLPPPRTSRLTVDDKLVLYFAVDKGTAVIHLTNDGRCLQRRDRESVPVPSEQIRFERQERLSREYDRAYIDGGEPGSLDLETVERIGEEIAAGLSAEKVLQLLGLADFSEGGVRLRRAAVLLLANDITHWHPRCEVRVLRVAGTELLAGRDYNVVSDKHVVGCILDLLSKAWEEIRPYLVETRLGPDGRFEEQVRYPEDACREALTNAIAHRDYSIEGRAIEVFVFDDRLEVRSPGALLSTVTIEGIKSLEGVHQSRNTTIARTLRELGYMREMGEGFRRIFHLMRAHDLVEPEIGADDQSFVVSLRHQSVFSEEDQRWIAAYESFELERDEQKVLLLGRQGDPLSIQQIMDALDLVDTEDYRALVERVQQKGLIIGIPRYRSGERTRKSPRWTVVQPKDANRHFGELVRAVQQASGVGGRDRLDYSRIGDLLSEGSPYRNAVPGALRRLRLVDSAGRATARAPAALRVLPEPDDRGRLPRARSRRPRDTRKRRVRMETPSVHGHAAAEAPEDDISLARDPRKLFIGNLAYESNAAGLAHLFGSVGPVADVSVPQDFRSGRDRNRGYGFVEMQNSTDAKRAKSALEGAELDGRQIYLAWARS